MRDFIFRQTIIKVTIRPAELRMSGNRPGSAHTALTWRQAIQLGLLVVSAVELVSQLEPRWCTPTTIEVHNG